MAEKRLLDAVSAVSYGKFPRLEADPGHLLPALCRSSGLPGLPSESHYSYKGSYFAYPLQCQDKPQTLAPWTAAETYEPCAGSGGGKSPRTEKALYVTQKPEAEGLEGQGRTPGHKKASEGVIQEALSGREQWARYLGHTGVIQQSWIQQASPSPALAALKPVYQSPAYAGAESGYCRKSALAVQTPTDHLSKQLLGPEWPSPPSALPENPRYGPAGPQKAPLAEAGVLQPEPGPRGTSGHLAAFSPYRKSFEKYQPVQSAPFVDASVPAMCQKSVAEAQGASPTKHVWSKLSPPSSLLVNPQDLLYQHASPPCYPLPTYPLASHEQMLLYHQSYMQAEKSNSFFTLAACKGFGSVGSEEAHLFPGSYFQQASRSYYPGHLESYVYQAIGPSPVMPPNPQPSRREEPTQSPQTMGDFAPKTSVSACRQLGKAALEGGSWPRKGSLPDWYEVSREMGRLSSPSLQAGPPVHQADRLLHCYGTVGRLQEGGYRKDLGPPEKVSAREEVSAEMHCRVSLDSECGRKNAHFSKAELGASVFISHHPFPRPGQNVLNDPDAQDTQQPLEHLEGVHKPLEGSSTSASPPMPVINNVFSLAPYKEYLDGSGELMELDLSKTGQAEELSPRSRCRSLEDQGLPGMGSPRLTEGSHVDLLGGKEAACNGITNVGDPELNKKGSWGEQKSGDYAELWERDRAKLLNPKDLVPGQLLPRRCSRDKVEALVQEDHVLDLSLKAEEDLQPLPQKAEAAESRSLKVKGERERPASSQEARGEASALPVESSARANGQFHSSAAFLFRKFKILKSRPREAGSAAESLSLQQGSDSQATPKRNSPLVESNSRQPATPSETLPLQPKCLDVPAPLPPAGPAGTVALREAQVLHPSPGDPLSRQNSPRQNFNALHASVCTIISCSVSTSSPEKLQEWLELQEKTARPAKPKNGQKVPVTPKPSRGKEIWLAFKDTEVLVRKLLSQLETFLFTHQCPFPHVVRAGTIFIPIHVVKGKLFPNLSGGSVDHVLQDHKVELRPTTLSEEKALRDLDLKSCTSRMLKLLALKQLPDIYPDLLNLHWWECVRQQLGPSSKAGLNTSK